MIMIVIVTKYGLLSFPIDLNCVDLLFYIVTVKVILIKYLLKCNYCLRQRNELQPL